MTPEEELCEGNKSRLLKKDVSVIYKKGTLNDEEKTLECLPIPLSHSAPLLKKYMKYFFQFKRSQPLHTLPETLSTSPVAMPHSYSTLSPEAFSGHSPCLCP